MATCSVCKKQGHKAPRCAEYRARALFYLNRLVTALEKPNATLTSWSDDWPKLRENAQAVIALLDAVTDYNLTIADRLLASMFDHWPRWRDGISEGFIIAPSYRKWLVHAFHAVKGMRDRQTDGV